MDDLLTGSSIIEEASSLQIEIHQTLLTVGFSLRKYMSNTKDVQFKNPLDLILPSTIRAKMML